MIEISLHKWENPFHAEFNQECCDQSVFYPNCSNICETRFEICLQPLYSSNNDCPYGFYRSPFDENIPNTDDITFEPGVALKGGVPNPISLSVSDPVSVSIQFVKEYIDDSHKNIVHFFRMEYKLYLRLGNSTLVQEMMSS